MSNITHDLITWCELSKKHVLHVLHLREGATKIYGIH